MVIVAAVDRSDRSKYVLEEAQRLADAFETDLHVIHVLSVGRFVELERTNVESKNEVLDMDEVREVAMSIATDAATDLDGNYKTVGLVGDVDEQIIRYGQDEGASHVVLSPRKRSPTGKALFGSVAQQVILNAPCPVVTVTN